MSKWVKNEIVFCWSAKMGGFFSGSVEDFDDKVLKIRTFTNGKVYSFHADGTAIHPEGRTNKRVFTKRELDEVINPEVENG